jgi:hypothetical protein
MLIPKFLHKLQKQAYQPIKASSRKPLCEEQNDKTVDSFRGHESDGYLPLQRVTLKTFHPYFSVTPPLVCAPANMEMRL